MTRAAKRIEADVLVIGSGIAGLTFALRVAERLSVVIVTKKAKVDSNTNYAQGGIAAVIDAADSYSRHTQDTLRAGAGLCHHERVEDLVRSGPRAVQDLIDWGVRFSMSDGRLSLGMEGGHSRPRIVHSQDLTGPAIESALVEAVGTNPRISVLEDHMALELIAAPYAEGRRCFGAWVLDAQGGGLLEIGSAFTFLASGGAAALYAHTTNPRIAVGDGIAMAYRAGAVVANMEFVQFHPTALYPAEEHAFLITEALRGAGAVLKDGEGEKFMRRYDPRRDLAARDIVARAVHSELLESGDTNVWLDATVVGTATLEREFPGVLRGCEARGLDPRVEPIPVVPAAHYTCGGIWTDREGRTSLPGLLAAGESSCTGVHGANRLASNSLLEAVVFSERAATHVNAASELPQPFDQTEPVSAPPDLSGVARADTDAVRRSLKRLLWESLGIVRRHSEIVLSAERLAALKERWDSLAAEAKPGSDPGAWERAAETGCMLDIAQLIMRCAVWRRESRGLHYDVEFPHPDNEVFLRDTVVAVRSEP